MSNHVNLIKGLAQRFEKNMLCQLSNSKKLRKVDKQILNQIRNNFAYIFTEDSDEVFQKNFFELISNNITKPYIITNFFVSNYEEYMSCPPCCNFTNCFRFEMRWLIASVLYH